MTDSDMEPRSDAGPGSAPKPRSKPPVRRTPPPPRAKRPDLVAGGSEAATQPLAAELAAMRAEIAELKARTSRVVDAEQALPPHARVADPETLTPFLQRLLEQTSPMPRDFAPPTVSYNHPERWFAIPDGRVALLQGSPQAIELYTSKGYKMLTPSETKEWLEVERPRLVRHQRRVAYLINGIRKAIAVEPKLQQGLDDDFDLKLERMTVSELEDLWAKIAGSGDSARLVLTMPERLRDEDDAEAERRERRLLDGVETNKRGMDDFDRVAGIDRPNIPQPRRSRDIEITQANARQFQ
jgi:hypothetical protein